MKIKDINIQEISNYPKEKLNTLRREVFADNELVEIPSILLPDVFESSYYFISYSHKDFRFVYDDILSLEEGGLNIWYDRGIPAGKKWKDIANDYMFPSECRGVIFYLSENSILSDAVIDEIKYAKKLKKAVIIIMLPFLNDYSYKGESTLNKYYSAHQVAVILKENGLSIDDKKINELLDLIPEEELYLPYNMEKSTKIEKIIKNAPDIPDFECGFMKDPFEKKKTNGLIVTKLNNYKISRIDENSFPIGKKEIKKIRFATGVCANAQLLESITIPSKYEVEIGGFAFYGCKSLTDIAIEKYHHGVIGEYAFSGCSSIENINIYDCAIIKSKAFLACNSLKRVTLNRVFRVMSEAFSNNKNLEYVDLGCAIEVGDNAFARCPNLKEVIISNEARYGGTVFSENESIERIDLDFSKIGGGSITDWTFAEMYGLKEANIVNGDWVDSNYIPEDLFFECKNLRKVSYKFNNEEEITISIYAFSGCHKLKEVDINSKATKICSKAFFECKSLDTLFSKEKGTLDLSGVKELEDRVFTSCAFKKIFIGYQLEQIGYDSFADCKKLKEIHINNNKINQDILTNALGKSDTTRNIDVYFRGKIEEFVVEEKTNNNYVLNVHCIDGDIQINI